MAKGAMCNILGGAGSVVGTASVYSKCVGNIFIVLFLREQANGEYDCNKMYK